MYACMYMHTYIYIRARMHAWGDTACDSSPKKVDEPWLQGQPEWYLGQPILGQPPNCLSKNRRDTGKREVPNIYFLLNGRDRRSQSFFFCSIRVVERLVHPRVVALRLEGNSRGAPLPAKRTCTGLEEPELVAQREEGLQTQLPGVQVAVWLDLAEPTPERFWKGAVLVNSQPI